MTRFLLAAALATAFAGSADAATYRIDPRHTQVFFTYTHHGYANLTGRLNEAQGEITYDPAKPAESSVSVELPMSSLSTGVPGLDKHLSSADFFDVEKFPTASFKSTKVSVRDATHLDVTGDLTMHGVTRPVTFAVTVNKVGEHTVSKAQMAGFDAVATIKRSDFGVDRMAPAVSDEVQLRITTETQVPRPEADAPAAPAGKKG
jgi:polyisoprenoid-binding protein YceI